ncbi:MAG: cobalamin-dependent protein [Actinomycetota bacterium]
MSELLDRFKEAIIEGDAEKGVELAEALVGEASATPVEIIDKLSGAMEVVGGRYETGEYFIPEMLRSADAVEKALAALEPYLFEHRHEASGVVVMGTVKGDVHNIGKNIIISALRAAGYEVHDLGVNVSTEKFISKVRDSGADLLLLSAFTTTTKRALLNIMEALKREGLREQVKVISGGASHSEELARDIGVDGFAQDVKSTLALCQQIMSDKTGTG